MTTRPELGKNFEPASFEMRWYRAQEDAGFFRPEAAGPDAVPYTLVIPPPNVTGRLHVGHALGRTLEDVLCRWRRMQGRAVLWLPGVDHAGIATQMVVERDLKERTGPLAARRHPRPDPPPRLVVRFLARLLHARRDALPRRAARLFG